MATAGLLMSAATLNETEAWRAVQERDGSADGSLIYAVKTTGIFCRPSCASRRPARENVVFFADPAAAVEAGFISACTAFYDGEHLDDIFALRRFSASDDFAQFHKAATGLQYWGAKILGRDNRDAAE